MIPGGYEARVLVLAIQQTCVQLPVYLNVA